MAAGVGFETPRVLGPEVARHATRIQTINEQRPSEHIAKWPMCNAPLITNRNSQHILTWLGPQFFKVPSAEGVGRGRAALTGHSVLFYTL